MIADMENPHSLINFPNERVLTSSRQTSRSASKTRSSIDYNST